MQIAKLSSKKDSCKYFFQTGFFFSFGFPGQPYPKTENARKPGPNQLPCPFGLN
jgi:hypothetical protein